MDKNEYQIKLDQINKLVDARDYKGALGVVETIDWRRVKSVRTLCMVADIYEANKMLRESKEILVLAYHRAPIGKMILYRLVELSLKMREFDEAVEYYTEYVENASNDNSKYILKYKIYRAKHAPIEEQIEILEKYKKWEYTERWAYELAKLYSRAGMTDKCIEECDDLILWFSEGKYVIKAMELKMQYQPLSPSQQEKYDRRNEPVKEPASRLIEKLDAAAGSTVKAAPEFAKAGELTKAASPEAAARTAAAQEPAAEKPAEPESLQEAPGTGEKSQELSGDQAAADAAVQVSAGLAEAVRAAMESRGLSEAAAALEPQEKPAETDPAEDLRNPQDLKERFSESFKDVLTRIRPEVPVAPAAVQPETEAAAALEMEKFAPAEELKEIQRQEQAPEEKADQAPVQEEKRPMNEADVDALLAEMASSMAAEIAAGEFSQAADGEEKAEEPVKPLETEGENTPVLKPEAEEVPALEPEAEEVPVLEPDTAELPVIEEVPQITEELPVKELEEEVLDQEVVLENAIISQTMASVQEGPKTQEMTQEKQEEESAPADATIQMPSLKELKERPGDPRMEQEERELEQLMPQQPKTRTLDKGAKPEKMTEEQKKLFTYFVKVPGMDQQILEAIHNSYINTGDKTSNAGNIAIMGRPGTGKTRLSDAMVKALCQELGLKAAKFASLEAADLNLGDPVQIVGNMAGGFLLIEKAGHLTDDAVEKLSRAMEFRTDSMILIVEDEKRNLQKLFANYPEFARKFTSTISIPVFTNDELVTFARTYSKEMGYKIDDMAVLALYTLIGDNQDEEQPVTIAGVKDMVDKAISRASRKKITRRKRVDENNRILLYEKDFDY